MALRAGAFPEKLGHSCSQPACAGKDRCITHPIGQRCTDDQPTIKGRTSANFGYSKPLSPVFTAPLAITSLRPARAIFFWNHARVAFNCVCFQIPASSQMENILYQSHVATFHPTAFENSNQPRFLSTRPETWHRVRFTRLCYYRYIVIRRIGSVFFVFTLTCVL
jgi:hypothetical protein